MMDMNVKFKRTGYLYAYIPGLSMHLYRFILTFVSSKNVSALLVLLYTMII